MPARRKHSPAAWHATFPKAPLLSSGVAWNGALVRRWRATSPEMDQPPLDRHYLTLHLGGPKRVTRRLDGRTTRADVALGALSFMPAGASARWSTEGPVDFAHVYLRSAALDHAVAQRFDRDPAKVTLRSPVGLDDVALACLFRAILEEIEAPKVGTRAYLDGLLGALAVRVVELCSDLDGTTPRARQPLAPHVLRRVLDHVEAHFAQDLALEDLAAVAGQSAYHFSRGFRMATGLPPYAFIVRRRLAAAKAMLRKNDETIEAIANACGFGSRTQFATTFRRHVGTTPSEYRRNA